MTDFRRSREVRVHSGISRAGRREDGSGGCPRIRRTLEWASQHHGCAAEREQQMNRERHRVSQGASGRPVKLRRATGHGSSAQAVFIRSVELYDIIVRAVGYVVPRISRGKARDGPLGLRTREHMGVQEKRAGDWAGKGLLDYTLRSELVSLMTITGEVNKRPCTPSRTNGRAPTASDVHG